jgi:zinc protease
MRVRIMDNIHWTEINGITTIWTEAPEPLRAGLMFRTGRVDETLITAGHTHLIEHLALADIGDFTQNSTGFVSETFTGFLTAGCPEDVSIFFRKLCENLASLPGDRLEAQKKILLAEAAGRQYNAYANLLTWRYGANGYGLIGLPELGIRGATAEQLQELRKKRFTSGNAILWLSGPVPADLRLDLPPGEKQTVPRFAPILQTFPCWFVDEQCGGVAASATVPRLPEGPIFHTIALKRMHEELRNNQAVSYNPVAIYNPQNADFAHFMLFADSEPSRRAELAKSFGELFEKFSEIDESEVEIARKVYLDHLTGSLAPPHNERLVVEVQATATDWLFGRSHETLDQIAEEACLAGANKVRSFVQDVRKNTIFAVPANIKIEPWMGDKAPVSSAKIVEGRDILHADAPVNTERLVVGPDGVSIKSASGSHFSVRYANLAAALHYDDGGLRLISSDSVWIWIEPTLWRNGAKVCEEIRGRIPAHLLLEQGPRDQAAIPKPKTNAWQRLRASLK